MSIVGGNRIALHFPSAVIYGAGTRKSRAYQSSVLLYTLFVIFIYSVYNK